MAPTPERKTGGNIILLGFVSLLNDISSEIIQPILPLFITAIGGTSLDVGLIGGISDGLPSILKVFAGYWSDRIGKRKPLVVGGYGLSAAAKLLLYLSNVWQQVLLFKIIERSGKGIRSAPRDAMISESAEKKVRGRGFGLHRAMDSSGAVIGSALAYLLWRAGLDFRMIFLIAGAFAVVSLIPFIKVRESFKARDSTANLMLGISNLSPELRRFLVISSLFAAANFSYMFFILRASQFFTGVLSIGAPLLLYILFNVFYAAFSLPAGIWSDKVGRKNVLTICYGLFAAVSLGFAFNTGIYGLIVLFALYGLVFAMLDGSEKAFVSDMSLPSIRSTSLGIYYGATGLAAVASGLIAGALWEQISPSASFLFGAAVAALASLALWMMRGPEKIL